MPPEAGAAETCPRSPPHRHVHCSGCSPHRPCRRRGEGPSTPQKQVQDEEADVKSTRDTVYDTSAGSVPTSWYYPADALLVPLRGVALTQRSGQVDGVGGADQSVAALTARSTSSSGSSRRAERSSAAALIRAVYPAASP
ncbi:hypothetical protein ACRAWF_18945 [Streptomyces sp. L7]